MKIFFFLVFIFYGSVSCAEDAILCTKGDTKQGLFFNFGQGAVYPYVDIGSHPTYTPRSSWVGKLIVKEEGFLVVTGQRTVVPCKAKNKQNTLLREIVTACQMYAVGEEYQQVKKYTIKRYTKKRGYEEWFDKIPIKEWQKADSLNYKFSKTPDYHYENCRKHKSGKRHMLLEIMQKI